MGTLKDLAIQLESTIEIKEGYENAIESSNYSLRIDALNAKILDLKVDIMNELHDL